jgi:hypothetical protein
MLPRDSPALWWDGFPVGFALTCVIEVPAYLLTFAALGWLRPPSGLRLRTALGLALAVNLITHPLLWLVAHHVSGGAGLAAAELGVVLVEGLVIAVVSRQLIISLAVALGVNALSTVLGLLLLRPIIGL